MGQQIIRQSNGDYQVQSSGGSKFYHVEMFGQHASSCDCPHFVLGRAICKHMQAAEQAEKQQTEQGEEAPPTPFLDAPLNGQGEFSLLK